MHRLYPQPPEALTTNQNHLNALYQFKDELEATFLMGAFAVVEDGEVPGWLAWRFAAWCEKKGITHHQTAEEAWNARMLPTTD
ncbi:hypothetical protein OV203_26105 [Nannocystis sp. ILAH1]|uniref:hypothetical protein n=1 Tax=Nannocystis sp. ILAH1 TaxID=2996789 RepID=UPI002271165A|nr:hypothetical protein [Nannocystis sp. ILAH1]MCY0990644.1 hypothetical protein [Nannocystis sp. ILAH1]